MNSIRLKSRSCCTRNVLVIFGVCIIGLHFFYNKTKPAGTDVVFNTLAVKVPETNRSELEICGRTDDEFTRGQLKLPETNLRHLNFYLQKGDTNLLKSELPNIIETQIREIQSKNCNEPNFLCGHSNSCGFGCQFHHRIGCLLLSYATNLPLIHDENNCWSYNNKWSEVFQKLGSNCTPGPNTYHWKWDNPLQYLNGKDFQHCKNIFNPPNSTNLPRLTYPLRFGIPVRAELGNAIEKLGQDPVLWLIGQFVKYAFKLNGKFEQDFLQERKDIGLNFSEPIVGFQVRRTDKYLEAANSVHEIDEYMIEAENYFKELELNLSRPLKRRVFIASDEINKISEDAKIRYPLWEIYNFDSKISSRNEGLIEIVRDISILSECNYVVCGLSSNVCRLILEIFNSKFPDAEKHLKSIDGVYEFPLWFSHSVQVKKLWKV